MPHDDLITAEEFAETKYDLPEGGRWHELNAGQIVVLQPPEDLHGTVVLNLSKAIGEWIRRANGGVTGYACFDQGIVVQRDPDTVYFPAISWFEGGTRFEETGREVTQSTPSLVVEVASTNDRRRKMRERVLSYHESGVDLVWVVDPIERKVNVLPLSLAARTVSRDQPLAAEPVLSGFSIFVEALFAEPKWWTS